MKNKRKCFVVGELSEVTEGGVEGRGHQHFSEAATGIDSARVLSGSPRCGLDVS